MNRDEASLDNNPTNNGGMECQCQGKQKADAHVIAWSSQSGSAILLFPAVVETVKGSLSETLNIEGSLIALTTLTFLIPPLMTLK